MTTKPENTDPRAAIVKRFLNEIREFVDGVQVVASWTTPDDVTDVLSEGTGNWHVRIGALKEWMSAVDAAEFERDTEPDAEEEGGGDNETEVTG